MTASQGYLLLQIISLFVAGAATVLKHYADEKKAKERVDADNARSDIEIHQMEQRFDGLHTQLKASLADLIFREGEVNRTRDQLMKAASSANIKIDLPAPAAVPLDIINQEILRVMSTLPDQVEKMAIAKMTAEVEEARAQKEALSIDGTIRSRVEDLFVLIQQTITQASGQNLVSLTKQSPTPILPERITFTQHELEAGKISRERPDIRQVFEFGKSKGWQVFLTFGTVRSPSLLAGWNEGADRWYPMLRIRRLDETTLATIAFDPMSGELTFTYQNSDRVKLEPVFEEIRQRLKGEAMIAACLVELLKEDRLKADNH